MTENWAVIQQALAEPFPSSEVEWRVQQLVETQKGERALVLAYLTSRAVMNRLDAVLGPQNWRDEYTRWGETGVRCRLYLRDSDSWVGKEDGADETDIEGTKGGFSAALKRAAVKWGIGRYLYYLGNTWTAVHTNRGKDRLYAGKGKYFDPPSLPAWALPNGQGSQGSQVGQAGQTQPAQGNAPATQEKPAGGQQEPAGNTNGNQCAVCGEEITSQKVIDYCNSNHGRSKLGGRLVCYNCQQNGAGNENTEQEQAPAQDDRGQQEGMQALMDAACAAVGQAGLDAVAAERVAGYLAAKRQFDQYRGPVQLQTLNPDQLTYLAELLQRQQADKLKTLVEKLEEIEVVQGYGEDPF